MLPSDALGGESIIAGIGEMLTLLMRHDPTFDVADFDPVTDRDRIADVTAAMDVRSTDLSEFRDHGGKLLMYQGWNDYPLRPQRAIDYIADVGRTMGEDAADAFLRLFMVPGMAHCAGGPGAWRADYVEPLVRWREDGVAPERIVAVQPGPAPMAHLAADERVTQERRFSRPLCPYPALAQYGGEGDVDDEASFHCATP